MRTYITNTKALSSRQFRHTAFPCNLEELRGFSGEEIPDPGENHPRSQGGQHQAGDLAEEAASLVYSLQPIEADGSPRR